MEARLLNGFDTDTVFTISAAVAQQLIKQRADFMAET